MRRASRGPIPVLLALCVCACDPEPAPRPAAPLDAELAHTYQTICATCHARPGIGAPLTGVDADWLERREKGMDALLVATVDGLGGMPPLGTCGDCSLDDFRALIRFMAGVP